MRILFVDDEQQVLDAVRDALRKERKKWELVFATGGEEAILQLRSRKFDVVVSDMKMPGVDGVMVLEVARAESPAAARIVLSGHADRAEALRVLPNSHQFLSKPCDTKTLRETIERAAQLQKLLESEALRSLVDRAGGLPSLPSVYYELSQAIASSKTSPRELSDIIEKDAAICAKVLQLVNSSYFGLARRVASVELAVVYLGVETLRTVILSAHVFKAPELKPKIAHYLQEQVQRNSLLVARIAKRLFQDKIQAEEAYTAGLLHDVGQIVLAVCMPDEFLKVVTTADSSKRPRYELEREMLGVSHNELGAYLLGLWGLPHSVVESAAYHHSPSESASSEFNALTAVHFAATLVEAAQGVAACGLSEACLDLAYLARVGVAQNLKKWEELAREELA